MTRAEFVHAMMATGRWKLREALEHAEELAEDDDFPPFDDEEVDEGDEALGALLEAVDLVIANRSSARDTLDKAVECLVEARGAFGDDEGDEDA